MTSPHSRPTATRQAVVFTNAAAGRARDALDEGLAALADAGVAYTCHWPATADELRAGVTRARRDADVVVLAGGDGTVNAALPALMGTGAPLGLLPLGTANDLARSLGLPKEPADAGAVLATGRVRHVDVARVNGHPFVNVAHVGLGVQARDQALNPAAKRRWRALSYPLSLLRMPGRLRPFRVEVVVDGRHARMRALHLAVGNGRYYGGGIPVEVGADVADGLLDAYCVPPHGPVGLVRAAWDVWRGGSPGSPVWRETGRAVEVRTRRRRRIIADGEHVAWTPARFEVIPAALAVVVQRDGGGNGE